MRSQPNRCFEKRVPLALSQLMTLPFSQEQNTLQTHKAASIALWAYQHHRPNKRRSTSSPEFFKNETANH
jgi:hypothetical protein